MEAFMRCVVQPNMDERLVFAPQTLSDQQLASGLLKRGAVGACFAGRFEKIYALQYAQVVWDVQLKQEPPAMFRASKPKLHFRANMKLEKGFVYKLV